MKLLIKSMMIMIMMISIIMVSIMAEYEKDPDIEALRDDFDQAVNYENEELAEKTLEKLQKLVDTKYSDLRASYLGSLTSSMARFTFFPWSKMSYAEDGSKIMDKAIKNSPNNVDVRLNRFFAYIQFPDFLKKSHYIQADARWFIENLKTKIIPKGAYQDVYKALSMFFIKEKDDKRYMQYFSKITKDKLKKEVAKYKKR